MTYYDLYLFDFDLTLVDTNEVIVKCFHKTMRELGLPSRADAELARLIGLPMREAVKTALGGATEEMVDRFVTVYRVYANRYMTAGTRFFPQSLPALTRLKEAGAKVGIVSSKTRPRIAERFELSSCNHLIDHIIGSEDVAKHKPDPEALEKALAYFQVPKERALYVGDHVVDAGAAQAAGVDFVAVLTGHTESYAFQPYPHRAIVPSVGDVPFISSFPS